MMVTLVPLVFLFIGMRVHAASVSSASYDPPATDTLAALYKSVSIDDCYPMSLLIQDNFTLSSLPQVLEYWSNRLYGSYFFVQTYDAPTPPVYAASATVARHPFTLQQRKEQEDIRRRQEEFEAYTTRDSGLPPSLPHRPQQSPAQIDTQRMLLIGTRPPKGICYHLDLMNNAIVSYANITETIQLFLPNVIRRGFPHYFFINYYWQYL